MLDERAWDPPQGVVPPGRRAFRGAGAMLNGESRGCTGEGGRSIVDQGGAIPVAEDVAAPRRHPPQDRRRLLQSETDAAHRSLDRLVDGGGFFDDLAAYAGFLECSFRAQAAVEAALDAWGAARLLADWPARRRAALARADLAHLAPSRCPAALAPLVVAGPAEAWGTLYVVEGATLGGRVLLQRVAALGPSARSASRYLAARGDATGPMWRRFVDALERAALEPEDDAAMIAAATRTFALFRDAFDGWDAGGAGRIG